MKISGRGVSWRVYHFHLNFMAAHPHLCNSVHNVLFPISGSFHTKLMEIREIFLI